MSTIAPHPPHVGDSHAGHNHDAHLAHHFDTPEQQFSSAKLGMWIFLGTEILMFGGLFCAYAVYRHNHPQVFEYAHYYLNKWLGAVNTLVLITSSLTMAWAVRSSQLGDSRSLRWLLALTILGGYIFLGIKSVEYHAKWEEAIFVGPNNKYRPDYTGSEKIAEAQGSTINPDSAKPAEAKPGEAAPLATTAPATGPSVAEPAGTVATTLPTTAPATIAAIPPAVGLKDSVSLAPIDPNAGGDDKAALVPQFVAPQGMSAAVLEARRQAADTGEIKYDALNARDQKQIYTFFGVYFIMTGLHGVHVVVGMSLIIWVLLRSMGPKHNAWAIPLIPGSFGLFLAVVGIIIAGAVGKELVVAGLGLAVLCVIWAMIWVPMRRNQSGESEFGPKYYTPVDLVGLYWHLVDLIWIFLFPLLYLIH